MKRRPISEASKAQREKVFMQPCAVCSGGPCDPAHICSRAQGGCNEPDCVIPLCRRHHHAYDQGGFDLLPALEPRFRRELAHAVQHIGLLGVLRRVTNDRWAALTAVPS